MGRELIGQKVIETAVAAAEESGAAAKMLDAVRDAKSLVSGFVRAPEDKVVADYNRGLLKNLADSQRLYPGSMQPPDKITSAYSYAMSAPALNKFGVGNKLSVVELGTGTDVSVPKALGERLDKYISVEMFDDARVAGAWKQHLNREGLNPENKLRILANSAKLPIASNSQDLVFGKSVPVFFFPHGAPPSITERSIAEAQRVLKPDGKLLLVGFTHFDESQGVKVLSKYFPDFEVFTPDKAELQSIRKSAKAFFETDSEFHGHLDMGTYRTFVGTKR